MAKDDAEPPPVEVIEELYAELDAAIEQAVDAAADGDDAASSEEED